MKRIAITAVLFASACTGTGTYYTSGPQYAPVASTQQVTESSSDGTTATTTVTTTSYQFTPAGEPAPAAPPVAEPTPPPAAPSLCDPSDSPAMCDAWGVIVDIGDILAASKDLSCKKAAASLNRYADGHASEINILITLDQRDSPARLQAWQARHQLEASSIMMAALDLDTRCDGANGKVDRALGRVGFRGLVGSR